MLEQLNKVRFALVRFQQPVTMPELIDAPMRIRFLCVLLGPRRDDIDYHEIGRAFATLMSNPVRSNNATTLYIFIAILCHRTECSSGRRFVGWC
jgi:hypothetical protein